MKEELCGGQECDLTTDIPGCSENVLPNDASNSSFYAIVKRDTEMKQIKKSQPKVKNIEKTEIYVRISKNLHMWKTSLTKSENVKKVKEELKRVNSSEKLKKRLNRMNIDLTVLKLDESIKCNPGSAAKKLVCGKFYLGSI